MSDANITFCRLLLQQARKDAKKAGVTIPKGLTTWADHSGTNPWYEVWDAKGGGPVWQGTADNAYDAKAKYIGWLVDKKNAENS